MNLGPVAWKYNDSEAYKTRRSGPARSFSMNLELSGNLSPSQAQSPRFGARTSKHGAEAGARGRSPRLESWLFCSLSEPDTRSPGARSSAPKTRILNLQFISKPDSDSETDASGPEAGPETRGPTLGARGSGPEAWARGLES